MAGHSHAKTVKHRKNAQDSKRAKIFTKASREITIAAKDGADPNFNSKLKIAIIKARAVNLPRDKIEAAIAKVSDGSVNDDYIEIRYNATLGQIGFIIECLTNNKNRSISDVRAVVTKHGGSIVETGSVEFKFTKIGRILFKKDACSEEKMLELTIESGADNFDVDDEYYAIETSIEAFHSVNDTLTNALQVQPEISELFWKAHHYLEIDSETSTKVEKIINALDDLDDVSNVYTDCIIL